jgi:formylglycine-generating enzyme required for sulfatase activity
MSDRPVTEYIPEDTPPPGDGMRWIPGGTFRMGDDNAYHEEAPAHTVAVSGFWIDAYVVTNANLAAFVTATGYRTVAERPLDPAAYPSLLTPGSSVFFMPTSPAKLGDIRSRWAYVPGAYWRHPEGRYDPTQPGTCIPRKVIKGGSYLCAPNYCRRYRPAARHPQMIDTGTCHIGFRCIFRPD